MLKLIGPAKKHQRKLMFNLKAWLIYIIMKTFYKYQKISDKTSSYNLNKADNKLFGSKTKWVVTEKIHGANFSISYASSTIKFAKRTGYLEDGEWFYNYHLIKPKLIKNIEKISQILNQTNFVVYGELFGGFYPENPNTFDRTQRINSQGVSVLPVELRAIQEGIYYSPDIQYCVFDIGLINPAGSIEFVDYTQVISCIGQTELLYAKPLVIDTFDNVIKYPTQWNSTIPESLGLKPMKPNTNIAEGIVCKPVCGNKITEGNRCIIKIKNVQFKEISEEFDLAQVSNSWQFVLGNLICQNRLNAVLSKLGQLNKSNVQEVIRAMCEDVWEDYWLNFSHCVIPDQSQATDLVCKYVTQLVQANI